ncbi:hypothetical protein HMPREF3224_00922 [Anaerococcus hydrogenalis]|nr:hypothetical protein HMPREF3224_00922 [Anaerococcus hydrogenalis]
MDLKVNFIKKIKEGVKNLLYFFACDLGGKPLKNSQEVIQ